MPPAREGHRVPAGASCALGTVLGQGVLFFFLCEMHCALPTASVPGTCHLRERVIGSQLVPPVHWGRYWDKGFFFSFCVKCIVRYPRPLSQGRATCERGS